MAGLRVLIAEDEPLEALSLREQITAIGHSVVGEGSNGKEAVELANSLSPDLIIMDIKMPDMNGIELYERMKEIDPLLQQKVVCITGDVVSSRNKAFLDETRLPCITKPFGIEELMHEVESVLGGQGKDAQATYSYC